MAKTKKGTGPIRVAVYFPEDDARTIEKAAERDGLSVTTWVRDAAAALARAGKSPRRSLSIE